MSSCPLSFFLCPPCHVIIIFMIVPKIVFRPALDHHPNVGINLKVSPVLLSSEASSSTELPNSSILSISLYHIIVAGQHSFCLSPPAAHPPCPARNNTPCVSGPDLFSTHPLPDTHPTSMKIFSQLKSTFGI